MAGPTGGTRPTFRATQCGIHRPTLEAAFAARIKSIDLDHLPSGPGRLVADLPAQLPEGHITHRAAKAPAASAARKGLNIEVLPHQDPGRGDQGRAHPVQRIPPEVPNPPVQPRNAPPHPGSPAGHLQPHPLRTGLTGVKALRAHLRGHLAALAPRVAAQPGEFQPQAPRGTQRAHLIAIAHDHPITQPEVNPDHFALPRRPCDGALHVLVL